MTERKERSAVDIRIPRERVCLILSLLCEGSSVRAIERVTQTDKKSILRLLSLVGAGCERLLDTMIQGLEVEHVECDELWSYISAKRATVERRKIANPEAGDAYTFRAADRATKLVLCFQLGKRSSFDAHDFAEKLARATTGRFALSSDGFNGYESAFDYALGSRIDYGQVIKEFAAPTGEEARKYGPARLIGQEKRAISGKPVEEEIGTSRIERFIWTMRTHLRRMTRLSNGFSRKKANLRAAISLVLAYLNFCKMHKAIRCTPGMAGGITRAPWSMAELFERAVGA